MILLLGGTSDAAPIAEQLARSGLRVLVSQATEVPLAASGHAQVECRQGPLDDSGLAELIRSRGIRTIVDATHPYAAVIRRRAQRVAGAIGVPYLSFLRLPALRPDEPGAEFAPDHAAAAAMAFGYGRPVLLTSGTNHLAPYAAQARRTGIRLVARVLPGPRSLAACRAVGLPDDCILTGRGPFSIEDNRSHIRRHAIGAMVTKDSGRAGGTPEKLAAARLEQCRLIVLSRPPHGPGDFSEIAPLVAAVLRVSEVGGTP
ncbi:MAG: precorrin-6A reductase [Thermoguttaceae bacterium]|jgi:precorrin-6A/cobalt-precorrin-6A reductase